MLPPWSRGHLSVLGKGTSFDHPLRAELEANGVPSSVPGEMTHVAAGQEPGNGVLTCHKRLDGKVPPVLRGPAIHVGHTCICGGANPSLRMKPSLVGNCRPISRR